jgi:predicted RNA-binding protein with PIN domain
MIIVVDAYNILKQKVSSDYITDEQRKKFIQQLTVYANRKNHTVISVFDGGLTRWPYETRKGKVTVWYSGERLSADELIKRLLASYPSHNTALVSSDRALRDYAARHKIATIDSLAFSKLLESPEASPELRIIKSTQKPIKTEGREVNPELDKLMEKASSIILYKKEDLDILEGCRLLEKGQTPSKKDKKLTKVIKKL